MERFNLGRTQSIVCNSSSSSTNSWQQAAAVAAARRGVLNFAPLRWAHRRTRHDSTTNTTSHKASARQQHVRKRARAHARPPARQPARPFVALASLHYYYIVSRLVDEGKRPLATVASNIDNDDDKPCGRPFDLKIDRRQFNRSAVRRFAFEYQNRNKSATENHWQ